jgi:uncharacterized Zn-finger protein
MEPFEVIAVDEVKVNCDGGSEFLGHPLVYLHIDMNIGEIECPYCSCLYVFKGKIQTVRVEYMQYQSSHSYLILLEADMNAMDAI